MGPLDSQGRGQVADGCFGRVVGSVRRWLSAIISGHFPPYPKFGERVSGPAKVLGSLGHDDPMREGCDPRISREPVGARNQAFPNRTCSRQLAAAAVAGDNVP